MRSRRSACRSPMLALVAPGIAAEDEGFVMPDRTTHCESVLVPVEGWQDRRKEVSRRVCLVAVELIRRVVDLIRARLGSDRDRRRAFELRLLAVRVDLEFADHIDGEQCSHAV